MATAQRLKDVGHPTDLVVVWSKNDEGVRRSVLGITFEPTEYYNRPLQVVDREGWVLEALPIMSGQKTMANNNGWEEYHWHDVAVLGIDGQLWLDQVRIETSNGHHDHRPSEPSDREVLPEDQYWRWDFVYRRKEREMAYRGRWDWETKYEPDARRFDNPTGGLIHAIEELRARAGLDPTEE